jgi:hypothetical protein
MVGVRSAIVIAAMVLVTVRGMIPLVIVVDVAVAALPMARIVLAVLPVGSNPVGPRIWRMRPIAIVPLVMRTVRIPIAFVTCPLGPLHGQ